MVLYHSRPSREAGSDAKQTEEEDTAKTNPGSSVDAELCQKRNRHGVDNDVADCGDDTGGEGYHELALAKALAVRPRASSKLL